MVSDFQEDGEEWKEETEDERLTPMYTIAIFLVAQTSSMIMDKLSSVSHFQHLKLNIKRKKETKKQKKKKRRKESKRKKEKEN